MGRFDNRRSPKMCRRKAQAKKKEREKRLADAVRAERAGRKKGKK